ncbi:MAG: 16S rRNA (cytidine(1402)-2'-O)-methyltransferase, partial [Woeseiaceae bacterium]|nr:16S rRNA (cytidine(1402)-2'-O)-methyltransferase [Woeseiaceae bacterium]MDX2607798.1 16S rRNA (cytidine(1402)-2'-O)-methyltransferase [Woeseiaceae bacterium]
MNSTSGTLFVVATPIGNLEDLTPRARQTLAEVDLIAAEDTRHTGRLLSHFGVKTRLLALHDHNEAELADKVIDKILAGQSVALVSDAGTPLVSDPGYRLVKAAHQRGVPVSPIPGASALTAALSVAGLATDKFCFEGFLPAKKKARFDVLANLRDEARTMVFYESVHRIEAAIAALCGVFGTSRSAYLGRELTKMHEQCVYATLGEIHAQLLDGSIIKKGEFVIVVGGSLETKASSLDLDSLLVELSGKLP